MVALPCAFIPLIYTFTLLASLSFALGGAATSPIFLACATSYTVVAGRGVVHRLALRSKAQHTMNILEEGHENVLDKHLAMERVVVPLGPVRKRINNVTRVLGKSNEDSGETDEHQGEDVPRVDE
jgi:hypothetical protein